MKTITLQYPISFPIAGSPETELVLAIGDFDGIHLGHREVIRRAVETAGRLGLPPAIMTFHPHPREVLGQDKYVRQLTPIEHRLALFEQLGIQIAYIVRFDLPFSQVSAAEFVDRVLAPLRVNTAVVGFDFTFGHKGSGNPDRLCELAAGRFAVEVVRPYHKEGTKISSTLIRELLSQGDVGQVKSLLGRYYSVSGTVVHGEARGRQIGFPTANVSLDATFIVPVNGVYAIRAELDGKPYSGVMNVGTKPTFDRGGNTQSLEAHLFDFSDTIYGSRISIEFIEYIRPERKFDSVGELVEQIRRDAEKAKAVLLENAENCLY